MVYYSFSTEKQLLNPSQGWQNWVEMNVSYILGSLGDIKNWEDKIHRIETLWKSAYVKKSSLCDFTTRIYKFSCPYTWIHKFQTQVTVRRLNCRSDEIAWKTVTHEIWSGSPEKLIRIIERTELHRFSAKYRDFFKGRGTRSELSIFSNFRVLNNRVSTVYIIYESVTPNLGL